MSHPTTLEELLDRVPTGTDDWEILSCAGQLISSVKVQKTVPLGIGFMAVLELARLELVDGRVWGDPPLAPGIEDLARVVAVIFGELERDPIWWKARYPRMLGTPEIQEPVQQIQALLRDSPMVRSATF